MENNKEEKTNKQNPNHGGIKSNADNHGTSKALEKGPSKEQEGSSNPQSQISQKEEKMEANLHNPNKEVTQVRFLIVLRLFHILNLNPMP
jgi:hypothetical protein